MNLKKEKGLTLIEILIVLSIVIITMLFANMNFNLFYRNVINNTNVNLLNNKILHIVSESSLYCKLQNKSGYLLFSDDGKKVKFFCNNIKINEYEVPNKFTFVDTESFYKRVGINNLGTVTEACTIRYKDGKEQIHTLTIRVGTKYVQIK